MRLDVRDHIGVRFRTPFTLMNLDRDDDAHNFIKWWATGGLDSDGLNWDDPPMSHEGDWLYLTGQDKTEDLFKTMSDQNIHDLDASFALALVALRINILNKMEMKELRFEWAAKELMKNKNDSAKKLGHCFVAMDHIETFVLGRTKAQHKAVSG
jgi:hypothetical protein